MKIETLKKSHLKRNIIIGVVTILISSAVILNFTKAKYRVTQSIPLVNGTINYSLADLNIVAITVDGENVDSIPDGNYKLTENSYCTVNGEKDRNITINYDSNTKTLNVTPFTTKGTKCYLDFVEYIPLMKDILLSNYPTVLTRSDFSTTITNTTTGTIYKSLDERQYDNDGEVYYFAGNPTDNWVYFANFYWRIIRINGDGTIRLIYQGNSATATGTEMQIRTSAFNSSYNDNAYVGFKYTNNNVHGTGTNSTILGVLNNWYSSNLANYADDIDTNAGFCNDRQPSTSSSSTNNQGGTGSTTTYYAGYIRLYKNKQPTFECTNNRDLFTISNASKGNKALQYPIGLITADEVAYAGGVWDINNTSYYLYTGQYYWTMSPSNYYNNALVFIVDANGDLDSTNVELSNGYGVRPVINLKADVTISSGDGTSSNPYVIATA